MGWKSFPMGKNILKYSDDLYKVWFNDLKIFSMVKSLDFDIKYSDDLYKYQNLMILP